MSVHAEDRAKFFNWAWRLTHFYSIQTKRAGIKIRFAPKRAQTRIAKWFGLWKQFIILKARQVGISTLFLLWHLDATMFTPNTTTCILAHNRETLHRLFRIIKIAYESCPERFQLASGEIWEKPHAKYDTKNELYFEGLNSRIYVALKVRSDTIHRLHVSEGAHIEHAEEVLTATLGAVPDEGIISVESTANGMGGLFFEMWEAAAGKESQYAPFFIGYQDDPDYCDQVEDPKAFEATLSAEERDLVSRYGLSLGNVAWRRRQLSDPAKRKKFAQEFPSNAEEAFLTTGRSPFDRQKVQDWIIRAPIESKMEGRLLYWIKPVAGRRYIVVCDAASGRGVESLEQEDLKESGTDYDVVQVWDCETLQLCAQFRGKWPYSKLHQIQYQLGREYNDAYLVTEATDHGLTVINNLTDHTDYPKSLIHSTQVLDQKSKKTQTKWGFYTNRKTKPLIIDHLAELIEEQQIVCYSRKMQSECLRFIIDDKGEMHAMEGYHDDCVMAAAIGLFCVPNALRGPCHRHKSRAGTQRHVMVYHGRMPFGSDFPPNQDLARVKAEDDFYCLYNADIADPKGKTDRGAFRLKEFFENDEKKAKILDVALHLAPIVIDAGTDFLFGKDVKVGVDGDDESATGAKIDEILKRTRFCSKLKESATLFQDIGHTHFKLYAEEIEGKRLACIEEVPYDYWFPNWSGVPLGQDSKDVRIVVYLTNVDQNNVETKYVYIENYYAPEGQQEFVCAKSLWLDKSGKIGQQVELETLSIPYAKEATPEPNYPLTMVEKTGLTELPLVALHVRKTVKERYGQSVLKKVLPLLHEINDRLTQLSLQFLKHLNAKLQIPESAVERNPDGSIKRVNMEVLLAKAGDPDAKYITNDNPLIEQSFVHIEKLIRKVAKLTHTPDSFLEEDEKGGVEKAESLRTRLMLFLKRISNYEGTYREAIEKIVRLALTIEGVKGAATVPLKITFDPGLPKEWQADATVWGDALAQGLASQETAVRMFQGLEGDELEEELSRIDGDKKEAMQSQLDLMDRQADTEEVEE